MTSLVRQIKEPLPTALVLLLIFIGYIKTNKSIVKQEK